MGYAAHSHRNFVQVHVFRSLWFWLFWQCESSEIKYVFLSMMPPTGHAQSYSCSCTRSPLDTLVKCGLFLCLLSPCLQLPLSCHHFFFFLNCGCFHCGCFGGSHSGVRTAFVFLSPSLHAQLEGLTGCQIFSDYNEQTLSCVLAPGIFIIRFCWPRCFSILTFRIWNWEVIAFFHLIHPWIYELY